MKHWHRVAFATLTTLSVLALTCVPAHAEPVNKGREVPPAPQETKVVATTSKWTEVSAEMAEGIIAGDEEVIEAAIEATQASALSKAVSFSPEGCQFSVQRMHVRSELPRNIGFKPTTSCNSPVREINHANSIERQSWIFWPTIWSGNRSAYNTHKWTQLDISKVCNANSPYNTFRGRTLSAILSNNGTWYVASLYTPAEPLPCDA